MKRPFSQLLKSDILRTARSAASTLGIINIPLLAEQVRKRNEAENIALEDIEYELLQQAQLLNVVMEFDAGRR
jgi:hypothetical protein